MRLIVLPSGKTTMRESQNPFSVVGEIELYPRLSISSVWIGSERISFEDNITFEVRGNGDYDFFVKGKNLSPTINFLIVFLTGEQIKKKLELSRNAA